MKIILGICTILGAIGAIAYFNYLLAIIKWWPSGWLVSLFLVFTIMYQKRLGYYRKKYGPNNDRKVINFGGRKTYLLEDDKYLRWIKNEKTFFELGYDWESVIHSSKENKDRYTELNPISICYFK
ncbi:MAG: hypothetical protein V1804_01100 [Patescibacteria group bacterium]